MKSKYTWNPDLIFFEDYEADQEQIPGFPWLVSLIVFAVSQEHPNAVFVLMDSLICMN